MIDKDGWFITETVHLGSKYKLVQYCDGSHGITDV